MEKIKALLEQIGGSPELADKIIEALNNYKDKARESIKEEYKNRLEKAKEACLEEVETYKKELARKTEIFFEAKANKIEQQIAKQAAVKDSAAEAKLQQIAALLEGVEVNGKGNSADIESAKKLVKQLQERKSKLESQIKTLTEKANRAHAIAEKTLERNRDLTKQLNEAKKAQGAISEDKDKAKSKGNGDGKGKNGKAAKTGKPDKQQINEGSKKGTATTTRRSSQDQISKPTKQSAEPPVASGVSQMGGYSPEAIAAGME